MWPALFVSPLDEGRRDVIAIPDPPGLGRMGWRHPVSAIIKNTAHQ